MARRKDKKNDEDWNGWNMDGIRMEYGWNMDGIWMEWGTMRPNLFQKPRGTRPVFADPAKAGKESAKGDHGGPQGWMGGKLFIIHQ